MKRQKKPSKKAISKTKHIIISGKDIESYTEKRLSQFGSHIFCKAINIAQSKF